MGSEPAWQPILGPSLRERAVAAVDDIGSALTDVDVDGIDCSLASGSAGLAVFLAYLADVRDDERLRSTSLRFLRHAVDGLRTRPMGSSLYAGLTGVGWAVAHLKDRLPVRADPARAVDGALLRHASRSPWTGEYDLVGGLVGIGVYARERAPQAEARALLQLVVDRLGATAERGGEGTRWISRREWLPAGVRPSYPARYYNLGLAHGVPGVAALLGVACSEGIAQARPLLDETASWILRQRLDDHDADFGTWRAEGVRPEPTRSAWCYGDPGVAAALLVAARHAGVPEWEEIAIDLAWKVARRPPDRTGVRDAGLCHGAAGLGHLFNRMYQATADPVLGDAARAWLSTALEMRRPHSGVAGFAALDRGDGGDVWRDEVGLLTGAAGIGLALLAATEQQEPAWDRLLLLS